MKDAIALVVIALACVVGMAATPHRPGAVPEALNIFRCRCMGDGDKWAVRVDGRIYVIERHGKYGSQYMTIASPDSIYTPEPTRE